MFQINDQVQVVDGRYNGRTGKVISCCPPSRRYSQSYVILPPGEKEMAFLADEHELQVVERMKVK